MTKKVLIGSIGVDSGQVMIGDPCYLDEWKANEFDASAAYPTEATGTFDYDGACRATCSAAGHGELGNGRAVASETLYGDGRYPVYAVYERNSTRPSRLIIEFADPDEDEENDEEGYLL